MKKNLLLIITTFFFNVSVKSQYASVWSAYPTSYKLSAGFATRQTPGTFWLGYLSTVQNVSSLSHINKNFCILGLGASSIWASYQIFETQGCSGSFSQVLDGNGVSAIETSGPNNLRYALAGVYDKACYFAALDHLGNVITAISYPFPHLPSGNFPEPTKPVITESNIPGQYFICGYFESNMYVILVNASGNIIWSRFYSIGIDAVPNDIIMNPFGTNELIIVGEVNLSPQEKQGFLMRVDVNSGIVKNVKTYGNLGMNDGFRTIISNTTALTAQGQGFIIGGYTTAGTQAGFSQPHTNSTSNHSGAWVLKLHSGGQIVWSRVLTPSTGTNTGVIDIVERLNSFNDYEYYALLNSNAGMQVLKLDDQGNPFPVSSPNALHNEFIYDLPSAQSATATSISYVNTPASTADVGIQVFGTANNFPGFSSSYAVSAYFNGETNCHRTLTTIQSVHPGSVFEMNIPFNQFGSFSSCNNFQIHAFFTGNSVNYPCYGLVAQGSNQRTLSFTGFADGEEPVKWRVYPNPVNIHDKFFVNYSQKENSKVTISLYNLMGQQLLNIIPDTNTEGEHEQVIDLVNLNIPAGVYIISTKIDETVYTQKIVLNN